MAKAIFNNKVIAESTDIVEMEGNKYFPMEAIKDEYFSGSQKTTSCHWKGKASYFTISVDGKTLEDGAWYYPEPKGLASEIKNRVAFWRGVKVE